MTAQQQNQRQQQQQQQQQQQLWSRVVKSKFSIKLLFDD